jgi:hypothetical protein
MAPSTLVKAPLFLFLVKLKQSFYRNCEESFEQFWSDMEFGIDF